MAEFCEKCFVEKLLNPTEQMLYDAHKIVIQLTEQPEFCEGCGEILPVVVSALPKRRMLY